jgi:hypothetical protein
MKKGDLVYAVMDDDDGKIEIGVAVVIHVGPKSVRIGPATGATSVLSGPAFNYRTILDADSRLLAPSRVEALRRYGRDLADRLVHMENEITHLQALVTRVHDLIAEE